jgi:hypothetical protein
MAGRAPWRSRLSVGARRRLKRYGLGPGGSAGFVVLVGLAVLLLWRGPGWLDSASLRSLTPVQRQSAVDADRARLIQVGAGVLAFGALLYTARNFALSREGHVNDRYTKAIEQLGSDHLDVRLGACWFRARWARPGRSAAVLAPGLGRWVLPVGACLAWPARPVGVAALARWSQSWAIHSITSRRSGRAG